MSVDTTERLATATPARTPRSRVRRRWVVIGIVAALLVGGFFALPLLVRLGQDVTPRIDGPDGLAVEKYGAQGTHFVHYTHGQQFTVTVPLTNDGPLPISVTDVRLTDEVSPLVTTESVSTDAATLPVTIGPGDTVPVVLTARFGNCRYYHERAVQTMSGAIVRGDVLGRPFRELAGFDHPLAVHSQVILRCPDRTLVRGDDIRGREPSPGRGNAVNSGGRAS